MKEIPDELETAVEGLESVSKYILLTHEHFDHIWDVITWLKKYHSKIICSVPWF